MVAESEECVGLGDDTRSRAHVGVPPHALADVCVTQANPIRSTSIFTSSLSQLKTVPSPPVSLQISTSHRRNLLWARPEPGCTRSFSCLWGSFRSSLLLQDAAACCRNVVSCLLFKCHLNPICPVPLFPLTCPSSPRVIRLLLFKTHVHAQQGNL